MAETVRVEVEAVLSKSKTDSLAKDLESVTNAVNGKDGRSAGMERMAVGAQQLQAAMASTLRTAQLIGTQFATNLATLQKTVALLNTAGGGAPGAGTGGGGGIGAVPGAAALPGPPPGAPPGAGSGGGGSGAGFWHNRRAAHAPFATIDVARMFHQGVGHAIGSWRDSSLWNAGSSMLMGATPWMGAAAPIGIAGAAAMQVAGAVSKNDESYQDIRRRVWQSGGALGRDRFINTTDEQHRRGNWTNALHPWHREGGYSRLQDLGVTGAEYGNFQSQMQRATGRPGNVDDVAKMDSVYGLGGETVGLYGAMAKGGAGNDTNRQSQVLGNIIGIAIGTKLEQGRFGELLSVTTREMNEAAARGDVNVENTLRKQAFIQSMGGRFAGDTAANAGMSQGLEALSTGAGGGFAKFMALQAAGLGQGVGFGEAQYKASLGTSGGNSVDSIMNRYGSVPMIRDAFMSGDMNRKGMVTMLLSKQTGVSQDKLMKAFETYFSKGMPGALPNAIDVLHGSILAGEDWKAKRDDIAHEEVRWSATASTDPAGLFSTGGTDPKKVGTSLLEESIHPEGAQWQEGAEHAAQGSGWSNIKTRAARIPAKLRGILDRVSKDLLKDMPGHTLNLDGKLSGSRTRAEQAALYEEYRRTGKHKAAEHSQHENDNAIDFDTDTDPAVQRYLEKNAGRYGLRQPMPNSDPGHFQLVNPKNSKAEKAEVSLDVHVYDHRVNAVQRAGSRRAVGPGAVFSGDRDRTV